MSEFQNYFIETVLFLAVLAAVIAVVFTCVFSLLLPVFMVAEEGRSKLWFLLYPVELVVWAAVWAAGRVWWEGLG